MSSLKNNAISQKLRTSAAENYYAAFERLKNNMPERLPKGTLVSQNNVAKEAGSDPSALKKTRYPSLILEIQKYVESFSKSCPPSARQHNALARKKKRGLRERNNEITQQRDHLASLLNEADATIIELYDRIAELEKQLPASNILALDPRGGRKL